MPVQRDDINRTHRLSRGRKRLGLLAMMLLAGAASANAGFNALADSAGGARAVAPAMVQGYEAQDHFPGSAYLYVTQDDAAPAPGVTGTAVLPALPSFARVQPASGDGSVIAAVATVFRGRTPLDNARALECLTAGIYYEAASESDEGQRAVAQVILNRVRHPAFPDSVCGVVYQGSERATGCQFSFSCDGAMARLPSRSGWAMARRIATLALAGSVYAPVGLATHYHTYAVRPVWNKSLVMTDAIGAHFFHRWKGWWGTPAAFSQAYAGVEPLPGPKRSLQMAVLPLEMSRLPIPVSVAPVAVLQSGDALPGTAAAIVADSQIREKYRDSGSWIAR